MDKKVTRKEFLLSALSMLGLFILGKSSSSIKNINPLKENNVYGNYSYGGIKKKIK